MVLERMNRIHEVDEALGYAVIEPGVTYKQLNEFLKANYPDLWSDSAGTTQFASVLGNALDKGRGLTPYADHLGAYVVWMLFCLMAGCLRPVADRKVIIMQNMYTNGGGALSRWFVYSVQFWHCCQGGYLVDAQA